mmetsp:Transcript_16000/g.60967  ORF Transcript_16000/g.60967 Transcript_16000/m.60967 type:complete len:308 (-) Transcript_16000:1478-2401(-)
MHQRNSTNDILHVPLQEADAFRILSYAALERVRLRIKIRRHAGQATDASVDLRLLLDLVQVPLVLVDQQLKAFDALGGIPCVHGERCQVHAHAAAQQLLAVRPKGRRAGGQISVVHVEALTQLHDALKRALKSLLAQGTAGRLCRTGSVRSAGQLERLLQITRPRIELLTRDLDSRFQLGKFHLQVLHALHVRGKCVAEPLHLVPNRLRGTEAVHAVARGVLAGAFGLSHLLQLQLQTPLKGVNAPRGKRRRGEGSHLNVPDGALYPLQTQGGAIPELVALLEQLLQRVGVRQELSRRHGRVREGER